MKTEKHKEILKEVDETVKLSLKAESLLSFQRRLTAMLSLGSQQLIEIYFHKLSIIKPGTQVKHEWFRLGERNLLLKLSAILTTEIRKVPKIQEILSLARVIEEDRNDLLYGSPLTDDKTLREKIDAYLELKKTAEVS